MDALGNILEPYSDVLAKFAGTVTCFQFLSGVFLMNDIRKRGISDPYPPEPFLGGFILTALSLKMGAIMADQTMIQVNVIGFFINVVFMGIFYYYATNDFRMKIWKKIGITTLVILAGLAYTNFEDPEKIEFRLGMLITGMLVTLVGLPLLSLGEIIAKKSTDGLPFPLILSGTVVAASWALYGISIKNAVVTYQNLLLFILSAVQLSLFAIYPNTPVKAGTLKGSKSSHKKSD